MSYEEFNDTLEYCEEYGLAPEYTTYEEYKELEDLLAEYGF